MSKNGEIYTTGKNFTLPPGLTGWTNFTSEAWSHNIETSLPKNGNRGAHFAKFLISNFLKGLTYTAVFIKKQFQCRKEEHCSRQAHFLLKKDRYDLYIMTSKPFKRCDPVYLSLLMLSESHIWQVGGPTWTSGGTNLLNWTGLDSTLEMLHHLRSRKGLVNHFKSLPSSSLIFVFLDALASLKTMLDIN